MERYVITGLGIHNGLGRTWQESWTNLLAGLSAVQYVTWPEDRDDQFPRTHASLKVHWAARDLDHNETYNPRFEYAWRHWDPNTRSCMQAVDQAVTSSGITATNVGVAVSTFGGGTTIRTDVFTALDRGQRAGPRKTLNMGLDYPAAQVAKVWGFTGVNTCMNSACTTGLTSIDYAVTQLRANPDLEAMVVGGSDYTADAIYMFWFQSLGALSQAPTLELASCPWDRRRSGFVMGEGASAIVIEPLSRARARGAYIYAEILSVAQHTLFDSDTSPDPEGLGAQQCVRMALERAGIGPHQVDYVNAHATSTPIGDDIEFAAMRAITPNRMMVSNKGQIGHAMSGCGIVETVYSCLTLDQQKTPPNVNLVEPLGEGMILPTVAKNIAAEYLIKNSFGFGGRNASMVLKRYVNSHS